MSIESYPAINSSLNTQRSNKGMSVASLGKQNEIDALMKTEVLESFLPTSERVILVPYVG